MNKGSFLTDPKRIKRNLAIGSLIYYVGLFLAIYFNIYDPINNTGVFFALLLIPVIVWAVFSQALEELKKRRE